MKVAANSVISSFKYVADDMDWDAPTCEGDGDGIIDVDGVDSNSEGDAADWESDMDGDADIDSGWESDRDMDVDSDTVVKKKDIHKGRVSVCSCCMQTSFLHSGRFNHMKTSGKLYAEMKTR